MKSQLFFRGGVVAFAATISSLVPVPWAAAHAADAPVVHLPSAEQTEARNRFNQGLRLFETGDYTAALAEFKRAYDLIPNVVVMYNIGLVYEATSRPVEAVDALDLALASGGLKLTDQQRNHARQVRDEQSSRVAQVMIITDRPASIEIDGVEAGRTPLAKPLRVPSGAHTISVVASGFLPSRKQVMFAGQVTETLTLTLMPSESTLAHLAVAVSVPGAEVLVNGKSAGFTPLAASIALLPGAARVDVRRAGYRTVSRTVTLDEGATGSVDVTLEEDPTAGATTQGRLRLAFNEPGAEVIVDGAARAIEPDGTLTLPVGPHHLRVQRLGFQPAERALELAADKETSLAVRLAPTLETKSQDQDAARGRSHRAWAAVAGGVAIAGGAAIYAGVTRHDIGNAQAALDARLAEEMTMGNRCYYDPNTLSKEYDAHGCPGEKASFEDDLRFAKLRRNIAYGVVGLGLVTAAVGTYLLATSSSGGHPDQQTSQISLWSDDRGGGVMVFGRF
jgi:hypothetical protein